MKNTIKYLIVLAIVAIFVPSLMAQTICGAGVTGCTRTTLSAALAAGSATTIMSVASATAIVASGTSVAAATNTGGQFFCLIDHELVTVRSISGTNITVARANKGLATGHVSGAQVICGGAGTWDANTGNMRGVFLGTGNFQPSGSCTRSRWQFTPVFAVSSEVRNGYAYDCLGGKIVQGTLPDAPDASPLILAITTGGMGQQAYSAAGTNTTDIATVEWLSSIYVPKTAWVTGLKFLCGNTCTTDLAVTILRDSGGNVIANTAVAGALVATANTFQTKAFTAAQFVVGPARYFCGVQGNGTTAGFVTTIATLTYPDVITGQLTSGTFGTIVNPATMPTTFTAGQGPICEIYY